jgi:hypothetical protein
MIMHGAEEYASMFDQVHTLGSNPERTELQEEALSC